VARAILFNSQSAFAADPTFGSDSCLSPEDKARKQELQRVRDQGNDLKCQPEILRVRFEGGNAA